MNKQIFKYTCIFILLAELFSFLGHYIPILNSIVFFAILLIALIASLKDLRYGAYMVLAELVIGSKGYIFSFEAGGVEISLRIGLFLVIMGAWLYHAIKKRKTSFFRSPLIWPYLLLGAFLAWGVINGYLKGNEFNNIFFDANGFIFFAYILPFYDAFGNKKHIEELFSVISAAIMMMVLKSFALLFIFSHKMFFIMPDIYRWVRDTGVGEITMMMNGDFYRIFLQSQIFALIGFFIYSSAWLLDNNKNRRFNYFMSVICLASVLLNFSRSFWAGGLLAGVFFAGILIFHIRYRLKKIIKTVLKFSGMLILSFILLIAIVKFPLPSGSGRFDADMLQDRATTLSDEAGASSRWSLLVPLLEASRKNMFLGSGFGSTVTYRSSDPRVLEQNREGWYTTFAFEWGYLDTILKIGSVGMAAYLYLLLTLWKRSWAALKNKKEKGLYLGLLIGFIALLATNAFSPYLNHPLGIGYIILLTALFKGGKNDNTVLETDR